MANRGIWSLSGAGLTTVLSGATLNALGIAAMSAASSTYVNQTNLDIYCDIEVFLDTLSPTAGAYVAIYIQEAVDGSTFPAQSAADMRLTSTQLLCVIPIGTTASTTQRVVARNIVLPPAAIRFLIDNQTGVAFAATANNTVKILPYSYNNNG
jgi:hypothetical protein